MFNRLVIVLLLAAVHQASGQSGALSPYSRFGIGIVEIPGGVTHGGMGGLTTPGWDAFAINFANPATYSSLLRTTFQMGGKGSWLTVSDSSTTQKLGGSRLTEVGFVFKRQGSRWAFGLGVMPYSTINYALTQKSNHPDIGTILYTYDGKGGINKATGGISRAFRLNKPGKGSSAHRLSLGVNVNYLFGALQQTRKVIFSDVNYFNTRINTFTNVYDFNADFGVHYLLPLREEKEGEKLVSSDNLILASTYSLGGNLNAKFNELTESFYYFSQVEVRIDTVLYTGDVPGLVYLPERIALGAAYLHTNRDQGYLMLGVDFKTQDWTKYSVNLDGTELPNDLKKAQTLSLGMEMIPKAVDKADSFFGRNTYRLGFRQTLTYLFINDTRIDETAFSAGISIPMIESRSTSKLNLSFEYGTSGTTENQLIRQEFFTFMMGFSFTPQSMNNWFVIRKYD